MIYPWPGSKWTEQVFVAKNSDELWVAGEMQI